MEKILLHRREFISGLGTTMAGVCMACLAACSKSSVIDPPSNINFSLDLTTNLLNVGASVVKDGVIIVRLAASDVPSSFTAVQQACTHEGTPINFNTGQGKFICPLHGSEFNTSGTVLSGPASASLKKFTITITGSTLTVTG